MYPLVCDLVCLFVHLLLQTFSHANSQPVLPPAVGMAPPLFARKTDQCTPILLRQLPPQGPGVNVEKTQFCCAPQRAPFRGSWLCVVVETRGGGGRGAWVSTMTFWCTPPPAPAPAPAPGPALAPAPQSPPRTGPRGG